MFYWLFRRHHRDHIAAGEAVYATRRAQVEEMIQGGWQPLATFSNLDVQPPPFEEVEFMRPGDEAPWRGKRAEFRSEFNIYDLWWRPATGMIQASASG